MATTIAPPKVRRPAGTHHAGRNGHGFGGGGFGGGEGPGDFGRSIPARTYRTGMWMALVAIVMLFAAFTSALVVRKGISHDWVATALPHILYLNTAVLLASSLTLELSRRSLATRQPERFQGWLYLTTGLGLMFIAGQLAAWRELASRGVYLSTNPSSAFFYLLTAAHGVHLLGGICALFYLVFRANRDASSAVELSDVSAAGTRARSESRYRTAVDVTAIYWHFMDGLWIYVLILLMVRF